MEGQRGREEAEQAHKADAVVGERGDTKQEKKAPDVKHWRWWITPEFKLEKRSK